MSGLVIDRIRDEMAKEGAYSPVAAIGEYVTQRIQQGAQLPEGKTLKGAYEAMRKWAQENRGKSSCVCIPPDRAFQLVDEYFGFQREEPQTIAAAPAPAAVEDELDLDALLGGL